MTENKLMKLAVMANALSAEASALSSTILTYINEEQSMASITRKAVAVKKIAKNRNAPKAKPTRRKAKVAKKVVEEQPKEETK